MSIFIVLKWIVVLLASAVALFLLIRLIGQRINGRTPPDGINESLYVDINGTRQWISIYGKNREHPVLLYLHGGPGASTSRYDYAFTRKWADVYTVVTWDQRNCGKSCCKSQNCTELTPDLLISDGLELTKFLLSYLKKEKITILGHSWGTYLGCRLVYAYPEYFDCYIGTGQMVDSRKNEIAFRAEASGWAGNDETGRKLVERLTVGTFSMEHLAARNALMKKYGYDMFAAGTDYSMVAAHVFNPYYSLRDFYRCIKADFSAYERFILSDAFSKLSILGNVDYQIPFYLVSGDRDYQTNYLIAQDYFDAVKAPRKKLYMMKNTTHGLLESKSDEFSQILHEIAGEESAEKESIQNDEGQH